MDNEKTKVRSKPLAMVISLPISSDGPAIKEALIKFSESNSRSLSNQVTVILRDRLQQEGLL